MIKSKYRISKFGEVFTSEELVNAMIDLVNKEVENTNSKVFEPACGVGNFLIEILSRKLDIINQQHFENPTDFERNIFLSVSNLYGIDILLDNVEECKVRLFNLFMSNYILSFDHYINQKFIDTVRYVISKNIVHGDALTLKHPCTGNPIVFSDWKFVSTNNVKRIEYKLNNIFSYKPFDINSLFFNLGDEELPPKPEQVHPQVHFLDLANDPI